jgi:2-polyprenyl-3-methyl-5-hydroxy-6-metoxy-1,4-benzoquinol methylase
MTGCILCGAQTKDKLTEQIRFGEVADVYKCMNCGLIFLEQGTIEIDNEFYKNDYHGNYLSRIEPTSVDPQSYHDKMYEVIAPWAERIKRHLDKEDVVLDFGCSAGHLMTHLSEDVGLIYGHEINENEVSFCKNVLGYDVAASDLHVRFSEDFFDVIVMSFVLEHIADPHKLLLTLGKLLKPEGKLIIIVPNADDPLLKMYDIDNFSEFYFCKEHLFYYTANTLKKILEQAGFAAEVEAIQEYPITNHLNWVFTGTPSNVTKARQLSVGQVKDEAVNNDLAKFWARVDQEYRVFLGEHGFADRVWCVAQNKKRGPC